MEDPIQPNPEKFRTVYEDGFRKWFQHYHHASKLYSLPHFCRSIRFAFPQQPCFPRGLRLRNAKHRTHSRAYVTGSSVWETSQANCDHALPSLRQHLEVEVAMTSPTAVSVAETSRSDLSWLTGASKNHIAVLTLAWAYILSARWIEKFPEHCTLEYTSRQAPLHGIDETSPRGDQNSNNVDFGGAASEEVRWWAAILAPGQGWRATMTLDGDTFLSPWSTCLQESPSFVLEWAPLSSMLPSTAAHTPASSSAATQFLDNFCKRNHATDQCHTALAVALLLPSMGKGQALSLPAPVTSEELPPVLQEHDDTGYELGHEWMYQGEQLDRLLTMSSYTRGVLPTMLSVFYEPSVECNTVTPWLQGVTAAFDSLIGGEPFILVRMFMDQQPEVALLWLGATILGLEKKLLRGVAFGQIPIDLHSAAWSGTIQSFMQQPVSAPLATNGCVSRGDECRLHFLSQSEYHRRLPVCQWRPFGATPLEDTDLEVRIHGGCRGHGLQYTGLFWDGVDGRVESPLVGTTSTRNRYPACRERSNHDSQIPIPYERLDYEKYFVSENATRSILGWLRFDGYAQKEKDIWTHEWFEMADSDMEDDENASESNSDKGHEFSSQVDRWLHGLEL